MPQTKPLVSVIVPIYNAKDHIARCVESIRRQTYENLEILLLNDGSEDVSLPVCQMFARVDKRITLIDKANSGVAATRNLGLRCATGEYLQFVDADDTLLPNATELLVDRAQRFAADLVIAHYNRITPARARGEGETQRPPRPDKVQTFGFLLEGPMDKQAFAAGLMQEPASFYYGVMWNKLYRADIVHAHDDILCAEDLDWSEDLYFNLSYIRYAERFYALSTPIYNYYNTPGSAVHTVLNPVNVVTTRAALFSYYKALYEQMGLYEEYKPQIYKYLVAAAES
ncbi:MAG TPA: glycosyltransferase [Candidatus Gemmiger excrementipullorum]|uniref:Glycosyltransferase n=1 Tax=Candidatus Gemmiger excrementipullorum TaxID=2838610 RepID=A0A9D2BUH6_9FIRM|nr:glycosyltransferase [Candidatus Gemmiger excrementipullorum]